MWSSSTDGLNVLVPSIMVRMSDPESRTAAPDQSDDDNLLERLDGMIDTALGDGLPEQSDVDPWERRERLLEAWTAILLGIAALLTTWASYQSTQWSDVEADAMETAATARANATQLAADASRVELIDTEVWLAWLSAYSVNKERVADFLQERFSPTLASAQAAWLKDSRFDPDGDPISVPAGTPFDENIYTVTERAQSERELDIAEDAVLLASGASEANGNFILIVVLLALSLFLVGIATKLGRPKIQVSMIVVGMVLMTISLVRIALLPHTF